MEKIKFLPEPTNGFYPTLRQRVHAHFLATGRDKYANAEAILKSILFTACFLASYGLILFGGLPPGAFFAAWFLMGVFLILAAMSIVHDAAHGMISPRPWVNRVLLRFANLV